MHKSIQEGDRIVVTAPHLYYQGWEGSITLIHGPSQYPYFARILPPEESGEKPFHTPLTRDEFVLHCEPLEVAG